MADDKIDLGEKTLQASEKHEHFYLHAQGYEF